MKKIFFISALLVACTNFCNAQNVKYHGEANLGYSIGSGYFGYNRVNLHTIQGAKVGEYASVGLGFGLDWWRGIYKEYWREKGMFDSGELTIPVYFNVKGYLPTSKDVADVAPYISCDLGYALALTQGIKQYGGGLYLSPAIGLKYNSLKVELAFVLQKIDDVDFEWEYETNSAPAFKFSVGCIF